MNYYMCVPQGKYNPNLSSPNFHGLTKAMKKRIYLDGQKDIEEIMKSHPNTNPITGQLPDFIFRKLKPENRKEAIREILKAFDEVALAIRNYASSEKNSYTFNMKARYRPDTVNEILTNVLSKYGIITKWDDITVDYIDQGGKGKVFKLEGLRDPDTEDEYVIKVFHQIKGENWQPFKSHGCYAEINNSTYWREREGHDTQRGKFYFGSMKSGYMVSKYLDLDVSIPQRTVPEYKYGIKCTDEEKDGPLNGYNFIKGYNYDYGGMRVVNRIKNSNKVARYYFEKLKSLKHRDRPLYWEYEFSRSRHEPNRESIIAGLALGIKHMQDKASYMERCIAMNIPVVNQALAYVLKYMSKDEALKYFERLVKTDDKITQVILFNEIPLLSKYRDENEKIHDDININLKEIQTDRVYKYYTIAEKYAMPETIEHLASFVHLLPHGRIKEQYGKLSDIDNYALQDRLIWKFNMLPNEFKEFALSKLTEKITDEKLILRLNALKENL